MSTASRVLVCGASPDNQNRNTVLRNYVVEGFTQLEGIDRVFNVPLEYAAEKAWEVRPGLVVCFGSCMPDDADYSKLRHYCSKTSTPMVFWLHDDPYEFDYSYKLKGVADIIFSNDRWCAEHYDHPHAYHLPLAASTKYHYRNIKADNKDINVFFCGVAFSNRVRLLRDLSKPLMTSKAMILGADWPTSELPFCKNDRLPNDELSGHYSRAWVTLNLGRDFHYANDRFKLVASTPGPRTFEAAMAGTTQVFFVESLEIIDYYQPGSEILLYDSVAEFTHQMTEMMEDRQRCLAIAQAAQQRTLRDHTYKCRAETILRHVSQY